MRWIWNRFYSRAKPRRARARAVRPLVEPLESRSLLAVVTALESGLWSDAATWDGNAPPTAVDTVVIPSGANVTLNANPTVAGMTIQAGGQLTFDPNATRVLSSSGNIEVAGMLQMRPASAAIRHELSFIGIVETNFVGGGEEVLASDVGLWIVGPGQLDAVGADKTPWSHLSAAVSAGATTFTVDDATGWRVGDLISITPTSPPSHSGSNLSWTAYDDRNITAISGNTITISATNPLTYDHPVVNDTWYAEVLNLSRNVKIHGTSSSSGRSHIMFTEITQPQELRNVEIYHMGPRKHRNGDSQDDLIPGRYPLHFHHAGDGTRGSLIENVVVRNSGNHSFVTHASHGMTFRGTIAHNVFEDAYWWDPDTDTSEGNGTNDTLYDHAVASKVFHRGMYLGTPTVDTFRTSGFRLGQGQRNSVINSVAVGMQGDLQGSGFQWPERTGEFVWTFQGNVAHNGATDGIFTWQNESSFLHVIEDFTAYYNGKHGIEHGAYGNEYLYRDSTLYGNLNSGFLIHSVSNSWGKPLTLDNLTIDGAEISWFGINTQKHRVSSHGKPTIIQNSTIKNLRTAPAEDSRSGTAIAWTGTGGEIASIPPEQYIIRNITFDGPYADLFHLSTTWTDFDADGVIDFGDINADGVIDSEDIGPTQTGGPELKGINPTSNIYVELQSGEAFRLRSSLYQWPNHGNLPLAPGWSGRKEAIRAAGTPIVDAGVNQSIFAPNNAFTLDATVSNPAPGGALTTTWSNVSGPGTVSFGDASAVDTMATFSTLGTYVLRLTASDGTFTHFDDVTVYYNPANPATSFTENWSGASGAPWPSTWTRQGPSNNWIVDINNNQGHIKRNSVNVSSGVFYLNNASAQDADISVKIKSNGSGIVTGVVARRSDSDPDTYFLLAFDSGDLNIYAVVDGAKYLLDRDDYINTGSGFNWMRFLVESNPDGSVRLRGRYWADGNTEPSGWHVEVPALSQFPQLAGKSGRSGLHIDTQGGSFREVWYDSFTANTNLAPVVTASVEPFPVGSAVGTANLDGTIADDGVAGPLTATWTKISGPGSVTFANKNAVDTTAAFSLKGTYVVRLTANDGNKSAYADAIVNVVQESFTGADGSAWPSQWVQQNGAGAATADIQAGQGRVTNGTTAINNVSLFNSTTQAENVDLSVRFRVDSNLVIPGFRARRADMRANTFYSAYTLPGTSGNVGIQAVVRGVATTLATGDFPLTANADYYMRLQVETNAVGTTDLRVKLWDAADAEPGAWTMQLTSGTPELQRVAGRFGISTGFYYAPSKTAYYDDFKAIAQVKENAAPTVAAIAHLDPAAAVWTVNLNGTVIDDRRPANSLNTTWTKVSGPGTVAFGNAAAVDTTATFSSSGAYVLRLTANDGARSKAKDVAINVVEETFSAADGSPWSSQWTRQQIGGTAPAATVQGNEGQIANAGGGFYGNVLMVNNAAASENVDQSVKFRLNGDFAWTSLIARRDDANPDTWYAAEINVKPGGTGALTIQKVVDGAATVLGTANFAVAPDTNYLMRFQVTSTRTGKTDLRIKVWAEGSSEPSAWTLAVLGDATAQLQGVAGRVGIRTLYYLAPPSRTAWYDDYRALLLG
ncbi:MAG TPA: G8 domain-containing protein [Pirellulaceae bacterium]|nr:G8 domain-containing protein [Pirellulaceae bacterium]